MKYKLLGKTGVEVSELCLGTMSFGGAADKEESSKMFNASRDAGINFFDCANVYEKGLSEEILGDLIVNSSRKLRCINCGPRCSGICSWTICRKVPDEIYYHR